MKVFYFDILANKLGAIGEREFFTREVRADNYDAAVLKLYDEFDHITIRGHSEWEDK